MDNAQSSSTPSTSQPKRPGKPRRLALRIAGLLAVLAAVSACVTEQNVTGEKKTFAYTWEQELKLGAESDKEIVKEMGLYPDNAVQDYVARIGQRVLENSDLRAPEAPQMYRDTKFTFRVLNTNVVNAFALPGGYVYVTRGLLAHVRNEAQLSVVLGHEIGHVSARHSSQQAKKAQFGNLAVLAGVLGGAILGEKLGFDPNTVASNVAKIGGQAAGYILLRYSREAEYEADEIGVRSAARTHYATAEGSAFFHSLERISDSAGEKVPTWAATHPDPGDRAVKIVQLSDTYRIPGESLVGEEDFLRRLEKMPVGENPREGFVENDVFYHPDLKLQFPLPQGWKSQNDPASFVMIEPNQRAVLVFQLAPGARARDAAAQFVKESGVQVASSTNTEINGHAATVLLGQAVSEQSATGVWSAFIELDGKVYHFLGLSAVDTLAAHRRSFESVASGFATVRDQRILAVQPARISILRTNRSGKLSDFLPDSLPKGLTPESLAIMNQVELAETLPSGRLLKIPKME